MHTRGPYPEHPVDALSATLLVALALGGGNSLGRHHPWAESVVVDDLNRFDEQPEPWRPLPGRRGPGSGHRGASPGRVDSGSPVIW